MKKNIWQMTAFVAAAAILAAGCGTGSLKETEPDDSRVAAAEKIQIEIGYDGDEQMSGALHKIAAGFNASQEKYEAVVDDAAGAWDLHAEEEQSGDGQSDEPELSASVVFTSDDVAASYAADDRRLDLRSYQSGDATSDALLSVVESLPERMYETVCDEEKGLYYLPVSVFAPVFYYNKTIYDELSLSLPRTYRELGENCAAIYAKHRIPGYLPYDLEGDIAAMLKEQEDLSAAIVASESAVAGEQESPSDATDGAVTGEQESPSDATDGAVTGEQESPSDTADDIMTADQVLEFFSGNCEAGYIRMVHHEAYAAMDFSTGAVAAFAGTPADYEMATEGVTFDVGAVPWIMDREDAIYWVDTTGMMFIDQGEEKNQGAAAFAEYVLRDTVCSEYLEAVGGISPYRTVYESQAYRKNRRGFNEITKAVSEMIPRSDLIMMSAAKRKEADELLLYMMEGRVSAKDAATILLG